MESVLDAPPPLKGRPREFCPDRALAAALRVFWLRGYDGASMAELTGEMGISKPSLYAAFGNKEELFKKALDLYEREKMAYMAAALEAPTSRQLAERLLMGAVAIQMSCSDPKGCLGVISSVACGPAAEPIRACVIERQDRVRAALVARLARARADGDLPGEIDVEALARYLIAVLQGLNLQASTGATPAELRSLVDMTLRTWPGR